MRKLATFLSLVLCLITGVSYAGGGPDAYGYIWRNNTDTSDVVYNWIDITTIGTQVTGLTDDNFVGPFNIGFNFHYYWSDNPKFWVGSNGYVSFQTNCNIASTAIGFPDIPTAGGNNNNFVAPFLQDLKHDSDDNTVNPSKVYYYTNNVDTLIISYEDVAFWTNTTSGWQGANSFQIILCGNDSSIIFQYKTQTGTWNSSYDAVANPLIVGIENLTGSVGLQVSNNVYPSPNTAVKFYYPDVVTYAIDDVSPEYNDNADNGGIFWLKDQIYTPVTNIKNTGNQPISTTFNVQGRIIPYGLITPVYNRTDSFNTPLNPGQSDLLTFGATFDPMATNAAPHSSFTLRTSTLLTGDDDPSNNTKDTEINVVDSTLASVVLKYDNDGQDGDLSWTGGNGGGGMYFIPPYYPCEIDSLQFYTFTVSPTTSFYANIVDDDGASNTPGTTLYTSLVPNSVIPQAAYAWLTVPLTTPLTVTSGGFYVSWVMNGDSIVFGTESAPPISNRSYEILSNTWAPYRSQSTEDMMIRVVLKGSTATSVTDISGVGTFQVGQNYPNPAVETTQIGLSLPKAGNVTLAVRDLMGRMVYTQELSGLNQGSNTINLNVSSLASGLYTYSLTFGETTLTRRLTVAH